MFFGDSSADLAGGGGGIIIEESSGLEGGCSGVFSLGAGGFSGRAATIAKNSNF